MGPALFGPIPGGSGDGPGRQLVEFAMSLQGSSVDYRPSGHVLVQLPIHPVVVDQQARSPDAAVEVTDGPPVVDSTTQDKLTKRNASQIDRGGGLGTI